MIKNKENRPSIDDDVDNVEIPPYNADSYDVGYIMTEMSDMYTFSDYTIDNISKTNTNKIFEYAQYLFIIIYNIYLLSLEGIVHNDLHLNNIFLDTNNSDELKGKLYVYDRDKPPIYIKTNKTPRIYDFDRAYKQGKNNDFLNEEFYVNYGQSNIFHPNKM